MALLVDPRAATVALDHGALVIAAHRAGFAHRVLAVALVGEEVFVVDVRRMSATSRGAGTWRR